MSQTTDLSALELRDAIARGEITAEQATTETLAALDRAEPTVQAFNEVYYEHAIEQARAVDARRQQGQPLGALAGVPLAVKDNMCLHYGHTTCSSKLLARFKAPYTATAVQKLLDAGAVILGKTNMDEFAMGSSTENSGFKPTGNPWKAGYVPGGSSGGSAAAVAARQCAAALGSDTGGSIRQPAAYCGVVGFKPTYGRVSRYGLVAFGSSLDQIGPLARDVRDAAVMTQIVAGYDPHDSTSVDREVPDYLADVDTPIEKLRIGLPKEYYDNPQALAEETRQAIQQAAETYKQAGAEIVEVSLPHSRIDIDASGELSSYAVACYYIVCMAEASSNLARYDGVRYGHRTPRLDGDIVDLYSRTRAEGFGEEVKRRVMLGTYALSSG
ncbi:MAG: amidase family protein, partial [Planctomycetota bacterium]